MATANERTVLEVRGMTIDIRSSSAVYIEIGGKTFHIDDSTDEAIMEWCPTQMTAEDEQDSNGLVGCGSRRLEGPDEEGLFDCLECGLWFDPKHMSYTHTPGPWKEYDCDTDGTPERGHLAGDIWGFGRDGQAAIVARAYYCEDGSAANARLIAASPELLDAAIRALEVLQDRVGARLGGIGHLRSQLEDAIAKATTGQKEEEL
jgi:hypothetical protein